MPVRLAVTKQTASGEQLVVDVCQWNPVTGDIIHEDISELTRLADECMKLGDIRSLEMHTRMLEAYNLKDYCTPEVWYRILSVLDILAGKVTADTVARRWQSEIEETAELESGRANALVNTRCGLCTKLVTNPSDLTGARLEGTDYLCVDCYNQLNRFTEVKNND
jgi:hypothetical protein